MIGPIRGVRLAAEIKLQIVRAVFAAKQAGMALERACETIQLDPRRLRRWVERRVIAGYADPTSIVSEAPVGLQDSLFDAPAPKPVRWDPASIDETALIDRAPIAKTAPHRLTDTERAEILAAAGEDALAHLRHRKLTHHLSREDRVFCSESTTLRVLREAGQVPVYHGRHRPHRPRPEVDESAPNRSWRYDFTTFPTLQGDYHLVPVIDGCSRKIVARGFAPEATSATVQLAWGKALANEGLLAEDGPRLPWAVSDRGTQMTSRSTQAFFADLGITQSFSRPRTPTDNATAESWMATLKCERLYDADTAKMTPDQVCSLIDRFIAYYNQERLHQGIGFVTPVERHEGRHTAIIQARREGMQQAQQRRRDEAYGGA